MASPLPDGLPEGAVLHPDLLELLPADFTGLCEGAHGPSNKPVGFDDIGAVFADPERAGGFRVWCEECADA